MYNAVKLFLFIFTLHALSLSSNALAYTFDYTKQPQFSFPDNGQSISQLIYSTQIMTYLNQKYGAQISQFSPHNTVLTQPLQFSWQFDWNNPAIGAGSLLNNNAFSIMLYGGFIRAEGSSFQFLAFSMCHEVGHLLGGAPYQRLGNHTQDEWSSAEGQADWFAASTCLPDLYSYFKTNYPELIQVNYPQMTQNLCQNSIQSDMCQWILSAGQNFADFADYYSERSPLKPLLTLSAVEVAPSTLISTYPTIQCRLDTIKNAVNFKLNNLCLNKDLNTSNNENCQRPKCWFADK